MAKHQSAELDALGILYRANSFPGLLIPIYRATGEIISAQFKPATPLSINGRSVKYLSPRGCASHLDVHPVNRTRIRDLDTPLWITEGVKKGDALTSRGCCVVTLMGVFNWRSKLGTLGDWEDVPLKGREVVICFDADAKKNMNVARAMVRLGRWCKSKGARLVKYLIVPGECHGKPTKGADDYFVAGDTLDMLLAAATPTEPDTETFDDAFSDARLAETLADDTLADHFVWNRSLGWFAWAGTHWSLGSEEAVTEVARQYVIGRFKSAADRSQKSQTAGWLKVMQAPRLRAVLSLTRGILERPVEAFDADADLLNTPTGTVHLPTGDMREHDPDQLITKVTRGSYRRGATHIDWEAALSAVPASVQPWLQVRIGQAFAGHPTPDGVVLVEHGAGENGKTALNTALLAAGGGYAGMASPRLLTGSKDSHTTERADLRGQRFVLAEELTEDRSLNTTAIKQIVDVTRIKARYINRDNFEFECSHSLFITTNYVPSINETDHGTWRRFALVTFPYTFKSSPRPLTNSTDRRGDPGLKPRLKAGQDGQHDAVITWVVDGAWQFYQSGLPVMPAIVERHTRAWRRQADRIL
ncbi:MAG: DUF3854 domain-containing protein, partial [Acidobacteria bacterium]|nr:DUF3854 domain-containing protein [Acidobacteriota bacterium]